MNVLNVCSNFDSITGGGEAERTFQMSLFLLGAGVKSRVLTVDTGLSEQRKNSLGKAVVIALPCLLRRFYLPRVSLAYIQRLVDDADVIHLMGHWTVLNALVYRAIRRAHKPYVVCPAGALSIFGRSRMLKNLYNRVIGKKIIRNASMCIAVTANEQNYFIASGVAAEKVLVIPNGIAEADFKSSNVDSFRKTHNLGAGPFILFVGRLNRIKGPDLLLQAFCNLKNSIREFELVFAGPDGGMLRELRAMARGSGVASRVHFVGYLGGTEKSDAYHAAQLLVIPSRHEAMSIVALEAGICGTPVMLTDQCGFDQLSEVGGGWVVPATIEGLERGLADVLSRRELMAPAALKIKKYVTECFSWEVIVQMYQSLYASLISESGGER
ncbi:MAG: glycosyltransferase [Betaproteobacteria bacterium]